jgi:hypothetical protein
MCFLYRAIFEKRGLPLRLIVSVSQIMLQGQQDAAPTPIELEIQSKELYAIYIAAGCVTGARGMTYQLKYLPANCCKSSGQPCISC